MHRVIVLGVLALLCLSTPRTGWCSTNGTNNNRQSLYQIRVVTFSPHQSIFAWYGHSALELINTATGQAHMFNFGGFYFDTKHLAEFIAGKFVFWSFVLPSERALIPYKAEDRHIVFQTLNLTDRQLHEIRRSLLNYLKPENRYYIYDHFQDNCSTKIRDIIDDAMGGALKQQTQQRDDLTFRDYVHRMMAKEPVLDFGLMFLLNDSVDKPITRWDSMFLPDRLMAVIQQSTNPAISAASEQPLVEKRIDSNIGAGIPYYAMDAEPVHTETREFVWGFFLLALVVVSAIFYYKKTRLLHHLYPGLISLFGLVFGICGTILFFMMCFTEHMDTYWNENILLLNPITLLLFPLGLAKLLGKAQSVFSWVSLMVGAAALSALFLKLFPIFDQANGQQLRVLLPALVIIGIVGLLDLRNWNPLMKDSKR